MGIRTLLSRTWLSWSSGKDSAWALHTLRQQGVYEVVGLLTTVNSAYDRVAMHGTRASVLRAQAAAAGLPLIELPLPWPCSNAQYEAVMRDACAAAVSDGVETMAFGDLYLEDVRSYREERLAGTGITPVFPLWGRDTHGLVREMLDGGLRARVTCVDPGNFRRHSQGGSWTHPCWRSCRPVPTHARRMASFTRARTPVRCLRGRSRWSPVRSNNTATSSLRISRWSEADHS
jgi:diphthamide synthase (EF-2-diphthine--ammonia ligase)